jgi:DnaJ-class molecular chaperone
MTEPDKKLCYACGGCGEITTVYREPCSHSSSFPTGIYQPYFPYCRKCNGSGIITRTIKNKCETCKGSGEILY